MAATLSQANAQLARLVGEFEMLVAVTRDQQDEIERLLAELTDRKDQVIAA